MAKKCVVESGRASYLQLATQKGLQSTQVFCSKLQDKNKSCNSVLPDICSFHEDVTMKESSLEKEHILQGTLKRKESELDGYGKHQTGNEDIDVAGIEYCFDKIIQQSSDVSTRSSTFQNVLTTEQNNVLLKRSAVEDARIRANKEAEAFMRTRQSTNRLQCESAELNEKTSKANYIVSMPEKMPQFSKRMRKSDENYKRRLAINRESAAISRIRRKAYILELEQKLAETEAAKIQLQGKLEAMTEHNRDLKDHLAIFLNSSYAQVL